MGFEYAKDNRTINQVKTDYHFGKVNEDKLMAALGYRYYSVNAKDKFGEISGYTPDYFVLIAGRWYPAEAKVTLAYLTYIELKENQCLNLAKIGGLYVQGIPSGYSIISASEIADRGTLIAAESTYCHKPCYRFRSPEWKDYKTKPWYQAKSYPPANY